MSEYKLETPNASTEIYSARGDEVEASRPAFTGDVYDGSDIGIVMLVQHPCAMRRGVDLISPLLAVRVGVATGGLPKDWASGSFKLMPLPDLQGSGAHAGRLDELLLVKPEELEASKRIATLSHFGVNLVLQRWVYHNSRVVVPTITYAQQTIGQYEEADLAQDWVECRDSLTPREALIELDKWLRQPLDGNGPTRQELLAVPQSASAVRRQARDQLKLLREQELEPSN